MAEGEKLIIAELQKMNGFLVNSMEAVYAKMEETVVAIGSVLDYLKETQKENKSGEDKKEATANKSAGVAGKAGPAELASGKGLLSNFSLKDIADNLVGLSKGLIIFGIADKMGGPKAFVKFIQDFSEAITGEGTLANPEQIQKQYESVGMAVALIGHGLSKLAIGLMLFAIPAKLKLTNLFISFIKEFFSKSVMRQLDPKKAKEVGKALISVAVGILKFAGYLMLATLAMAIGGPGLLIILPAIMLVFGVFSLFSSKMKTINQGARAVKDLAFGLLAFTGALILTRFVRAEDMLTAIGVIAVFSLFVLAMGLIGKISGGAKGLEGSGRAVMEMSAGLMVFTLALIVMQFVQWADILKAIVVVAVFSLFIYALGESKDAKQGAIAFAIISLSMIALAFAIMQYADIEWETIGKAGASLAGITASVLLLGISGNETLIGSFALIVATISVAALGYTLKMWQDWAITDHTLIQAGLAIGGITAALLLLSINPAGVIVGAVALIVSAISVAALGFALKLWQDFAITDETLISAGLAIGGITVALIVLGTAGPFVLIGAAAFAVMAFTLVGAFYAFGLGLQKFKEVAWNQVDQDSIHLALVGIPSSIMEGYLKGGGPLIMLALPTLFAASLAMSPMIAALSEYKKAGVTSEDAQSAGDMIKNFLGAVRSPIEELGKGGGIFTDSAFENGLDVIQGLGSAVAEIAKGVLAASRLEYKGLDGKIIKITPADFGLVGTNVAAMIDSLKTPIMEIGANSKPAQSQGLLGGLGLGMLLPDDNDFRQGMLAIDGLGSLLSSIAKGVIDFASMQFKGLDGKIVKVDATKIADVAANVGMLIDGLKTPIIAVGQASMKTDTGLFGAIFGDAAMLNGMQIPADAGFKEGMDAIGGLGAFIAGIASGVKDMATMQFTDASGKMVPLGKPQIDAVATNVASLITALTVPITSIGKASIQMDTGVVGWMFGDTFRDKTVAMPADAGFKEGMDAIGGLGALLSGIANAVKTFGVGKFPDPENPKGPYIDVLTILPKMKTVFSTILAGMITPITSFSKMNVDILKDAKKNVKGVADFTGTLSGIVTTSGEIVTKYSAMKDFGPTLIGATTAINSAAGALFLNGTFAKQNDAKNFQMMSAGIIKLGDMEGKLKSVAVSMKSISESLVNVFTSLNTVMTDKLTALSELFQKMVEVDKVDADALDRKIASYKSYLEMINTMNVKQMQSVQNTAAATTSSMEKTLADLATALAGLAEKIDGSNALLKKVVNNTYNKGDQYDTTA